MRLLSAFLLLASMASAAGRPNIVFIFTDDQAPWALGLSGHPYAVTPNLDELFESGAWLRNSFVVTPVCSPSRASLMTSRYGSELGITEWINPRREPFLGLDPAHPSWPKLLQQSGYRTGLSGKWHLGLPGEFHPTKQGYGWFAGLRGGGTTPDNPVLEKDGKEQRFEGFTVDIVTDHALEFLRASAARDEPFLLSLHYREPHARWLPVRDEDWAPFAGMDPEPPHPDYPKLDVERVKSMTREYLASVHSVDRNVGRVMKTLDELGVRENTIVIFTSDHGYSMGHNGIWHKGNGIWVLTENPPATANIPDGQRPNMWDNSLLVPTAVVWPGVIQPGTVIRETVSNLDWHPTIVEMAGAAIPQDAVIRGRSIVPLLKGGARGWENGLYAEYSTHHQSRSDMRMYRTPRWKLVRDFLDPARDELYNLEKDPEERENLIRSNSREARRMIRELHAKIVEKMRETDDPVLKVASEGQVR